MKILVLGYGKIGSTICDFLAEEKIGEVAVADSYPAAVEQANKSGYTAQTVDTKDPASLASTLKGYEIVINALPFTQNIAVSSAAAKAGVAYFDLSEDVAATRHIRNLASQTPNVAFMPQCGLAPGFVSIAAYDLAQRFDHVHNLSCRVGALPVYPTNILKYNLTWSTEGLINEYCMPCEAIVDGTLREVLPLEGLEEFSLDGHTYECFNTSGGIGALCQTLAGKVQALTYKSIRYPGHCDAMRLLINELGLGRKRELLKSILEESIPATLQDEVIIFISANGLRGGKLLQENMLYRIYGREAAGKFRSAIQLSTAAGLCGAVTLYTRGKLPRSGLINQELISLADFMATPFGRYYAH